MTLTHPTANNAFIAECFLVDELLKQLTELRGNHFNADADTARNWGEVGSVTFLRQKLEEALAHYEGEAK